MSLCPVLGTSSMTWVTPRRSVCASSRSTRRRCTSYPGLQAGRLFIHARTDGSTTYHARTVGRVEEHCLRVPCCQPCRASRGLLRFLMLQTHSPTAPKARLPLPRCSKLKKKQLHGQSCSYRAKESVRQIRASGLKAPRARWDVGSWLGWGMYFSGEYLLRS